MQPRQLYRQRMILGSLVVLWIGVLPWLCWGGWSSPHHPHASPHFVFAKPSLYHADHHTHSIDPDHEPIAGIVHPDTLLIMLLAYLLPAGRIIVNPRYHHFIRNLTIQWAHISAIAVPTPPPQRLATY